MNAFLTRIFFCMASIFARYVLRVGKAAPQYAVIIDMYCSHGFSRLVRHADALLASHHRLNFPLCDGYRYMMALVSWLCNQRHVWNDKAMRGTNMTRVEAFRQMEKEELRLAGSDLKQRKLVAIPFKP